MQVREAIIEKDFWVCWILDYLFHDSPWKNSLAFKGGTSLSKAYGAIERFSEDIDLILDWTLLKYSEAEVFKDRSGKKQDVFREEVNSRLVSLLKNEFVPVLESDMRARLSDKIGIAQEGKLIFVEYPRSFSNEAIRPEVILEIGPKGLAIPNEQRSIGPYSASAFPRLFTVPAILVRTITAERTFWEKATILHREAHKTDEKNLHRVSRHYYDLYRLGQTPILDRALDRIDLLEEVVGFKMRFYRCNWAKYEAAKPGSFRLLPPDSNLPALKRDYESMREMLFGAVPSFDEVLTGLSALEAKINIRV